MKQSNFPQISQQMHNDDTPSLILTKSNKPKCNLTNCKKIFTNNGNQHQHQSVINNESLTNTKSQNDTMYIKMMSFMRQQIQISTKFYTQKINIQLKQQTQVIKKLRQQLIKNKLQLQQKQKYIKMLQNQISPKKKLQVVSKEKINFNNQQINSITKKINNLQNKIQQIYQKQKIYQNDRYNLNNAINQINHKTISYFGGKINLCKFKLDQFINKQNKYINHLQQQLNKIYKFDHQNHKEIINSKIKYMGNFIIELKNRLQQFIGKQFQYQNYQLDTLENWMKQIKNQLKLAQQDRSNLYTYINRQLSHTRQLQKTMSLELNNHRKKSLNQSQLKASQHTRNESKIQSNPIIDRNDNYSNSNDSQEYQNVSSNNDQNQDVFFYPNQDQENQGQTRLIEVLKSMNIPLPILVQIDQTGYLKSTVTGMYIVDNDGDGFQLTQDQINNLLIKKIIKIV